MALYGNLRNYQFMKETDDIRGATLYGTGDEKLGKIEDIIFDQSNGDVRYVVVDAGGWLHTRKFLVPAGEIMTREEGDNDFQVNMTKEQIERLPEYKEEELESLEDLKIKNQKTATFYDLMLRVQGAQPLYLRDAVDVTETILERLNAGYEAERK